MNQMKIHGISSLIAVLCLIPVNSLAQEEIVKRRKDFMEANYDALKAIRKAVSKNDYATIEVKAKEIMGYMDKLADYFPQGSISEKSRAVLEIWKRWDEFIKLSNKVKEVAEALANAAQAKDEAKVQAQLNALGPKGPFRSGACFDCHKDFRPRRKK